MKLCEKPLFRWKEPKAFLQKRDAQEEARGRWWHKPLLACAYFLMLLGSWALAKMAPNKTPPGVEHALPLAVGGALLFAYGLPWLLRVVPSSSDVRFFSPRIVRSRFGSQFWDYSKIRSFEWMSTQEYDVLLFTYGPKKHGVSLGLPLNMDIDGMTRFLSERGIPHSSPPI